MIWWLEFRRVLFRSRICKDNSVGWEETDLSGCTSTQFLALNSSVSMTVNGSSWHYMTDHDRTWRYMTVQDSNLVYKKSDKQSFRAQTCVCGIWIKLFKQSLNCLINLTVSMNFLMAVVSNKFMVHLFYNDQSYIKWNVILGIGYVVARPVLGWPFYRCRTLYSSCVFQLNRLLERRPDNKSVPVYAADSSSYTYLAIDVVKSLRNATHQVRESFGSTAKGINVCHSRTWFCKSYEYQRYEMVLDGALIEITVGI